MLQLNQIKVPYHHDKNEVFTYALQQLPPHERKKYRGGFCHICKRSLDARKKDNIHYSYQLQLFTKQEKTLYEKVSSISDLPISPLPSSILKLLPRPVVLGYGPAGLFAAYALALAGLKPIIIEQGETWEKRQKRVFRYWTKASLHPYSNVQFGEGGAGTFSDGKLATTIKDGLLKNILMSLVKAGADPSILVTSKPHIGTDKLVHLLSSYRKKLQELGATFYFQTELKKLDIEPIEGKAKLKGLFLSSWTSLEKKDGREEKAPASTVTCTLDKQNISKVSCVPPLNFKEWYLPCELLFLAPGHSSRELYYHLAIQGLTMEKKAFAVGFRIEHSQAWLNACQLGEAFLATEKPEACDYKVTYTSKAGRGIYSFCMCPGGMVIASASGQEQVLTNGMSRSSRNTRWANAALLAQVPVEDINVWIKQLYKQVEVLSFSPSLPITDERKDASKLSLKELDKLDLPYQTRDFYALSSLKTWISRAKEYPVLEGILFQTYLEALTYFHSPDGASAAAQNVEDFISEREVVNKSELFPYGLSYRPGVYAANFHHFFPKSLNKDFVEALQSFTHKMKGFSSSEAYLIGVESRSSAPLRIVRDKVSGESSLTGLYPCGEGAGYAGGISSSAVDGLKQVLRFLRNYTNEIPLTRLL